VNENFLFGRGLVFLNDVHSFAVRRISLISRVFPVFLRAFCRANEDGVLIAFRNATLRWSHATGAVLGVSALEASTKGSVLNG
jgi:hypothetical protein